MSSEELDRVLRDRDRLAAVRRTEMLDSPAEEVFDRLTRLAAKLTGAPVTFVSLVDEDRDFYKSCVGFGEPLASERQMAGTTFCHYAIQGDHPLVIPDTRADPEYRLVPTVESLGVAAYLGIPLKTADGQTIGSFCAADLKPREWSQTDIEVLTELAASTMREIELRATARETERAVALQEGQARVLEMVATAAPLPDVLETLARMVERQSDGMLASILILDRDGAHLRHGAAPSLPEAYNQAIDGVEIGESVGSCGTAAYRKEPVIVCDIEEDPLWENFRDLARRFGLRACWSTPIRGAENRVLGTFALYYRTAREPRERDLELIGIATHLAGIAIQRARNEEEREHLLSELKATIANEEEARAEAEEANAAKMTFLATMSHDLRTPLNAIGGYVDLLDLGIRGPVTAEQRKDLERIRRAQQHLLTLIDDILNFAKLEAGQIRFHLSDVPVDEALREMHALFKPQVRMKGLEYEYRSGGESALVRADRDRMEQVVLNLLTNAIKFSEPGGRLVLGWHPRGDEVEICVQDTGPGIPPEKLAFIFEPFVQAHQGHTRPYDGVGLGLAIARDLAHGMGGELQVESTLGEGTTFTLTLPLAYATVSQP